jgi:MFS family permease
MSSVSEALGYLMSMYLNQRVGRKRMFLVYCAGACLSCGLVAMVPPINGTTSTTTTTTTLNHAGGSSMVNSILIALFVSAGKTMISAAFSSAYVYTAVFFPARMRTTMLMLISSVGRFGSMLSPQVNLLGSLVWSPLTYVIYSASALLSLLFVLLLKEQETEELELEQEQTAAE